MLMIIASRDGRRYEITAEDQDEIRRMAVANGGDVKKAVEDFHQKKFGEPFLPPAKMDRQKAIEAVHQAMEDCYSGSGSSAAESQEKGRLAAEEVIAALSGDPQKLALAEVVLKYKDKILSDCCDPGEPAELWMELADWFEKQERTGGAK
jgi:hypothetical protein